MSPASQKRVAKKSAAKKTTTKQHAAKKTTTNKSAAMKATTKQRAEETAAVQALVVETPVEEVPVVEAPIEGEPVPSVHPNKAPNPILIAFEARAPLETVAGLFASPMLRGAPTGDGHPVIVLPPFGAADQFTAGMRRFLKQQGYTVFPWGHPEILGLHRLVQVAAERLGQVREETGQRVSLIGHSLGGVYARELARFAPQNVRFVITLGSPISDLKANYVWPMFEATSGTRVASLPPEFAERMGQAPPVPTTSIFSKTDGVVSWRSCLDRSSGQVENVEVSSSHIGLPSNPLALLVVADRLAQPADDWRPFQRSGIRRFFYRGRR